ncbi:hypothetical protein LCGC14_2545290, partial [marine sediment metagenome]
VETYTITDLGTFGGPSSYAWGINNSGQVAGYAYNTSVQNRAYLWDSGSGMNNLGTLGGATSYGRAINDSGHVAGVSYNAAGISRVSVGFRLRHG